MIFNNRKNNILYIGHWTIHQTFPLRYTSTTYGTSAIEFTIESIHLLFYETAIPKVYHDTNRPLSRARLILTQLLALAYNILFDGKFIRAL